MRFHSLFCLVILSLLPLLGGCRITRTLADPCVVLNTSGGTELGVSTEYGVVFLGRTARAGDLDLVAYFGDGASVERTVVEPIAGGIYTVESEIRLPDVPLHFVEPASGDELLVAGRNADGKWERWVEVERDPRVDGILFRPVGQLRGHDDQVGAGVYYCPGGDEKDRRLLGLVSGRIRLSGPSGTKEYVTVLGPRDLWRLVTYRRDLERPKDWVYREDIQ